MAIENVRLAETMIVDQGDPRLAEAEDGLRFAMENYRWYVLGTNEPVTVGDRHEARRYLLGQYQVGDYVELDRGWPTRGNITHITDDMVRAECKRDQNSWRFDREKFVDMVMIGRPTKVTRKRPASDEQW